MQSIADELGNYTTVPRQVSNLARHFPSLAYYSRFVSYVFRYSNLAQKGKYGAEEWWRSSLLSMQALETVGVEIEIRGLANLQTFHGPCVFIGNHMSTMETICLPSVVQPYKDCTFVVKRGIVEYPIFKHIMLARDPIVVDRENPREDLKAVLEEGCKLLERGCSVIVFPQTTRTVSFDPEHFNTIGVKLAKRANVPVVPIALKTDAWGIGSWVKELGWIDPTKKIHITFGAPIEIQSRGNDEHKQIIEFIQNHLQRWQNESQGQEPMPVNQQT